jgi:OOP family OmpA-OmpF porin
VVAGQDKQVDLSLRTPNPDVSLNGYTIALRAPIKFRAGAPRLGPKDQEELAAVAAILQDHPEIRTLRVEAHWDASVGLLAKPMTEHQAQAIKDHLVKMGVDAGRIEAAGLGADQPLAPSIGTGRTKNRRIELHVVY